jgi:hypothetical protein
MLRRRKTNLLVTILLLAALAPARAQRSASPRAAALAE